jgi:hypothetical protein
LGYTTTFEGKFQFNRPLDDQAYTFLLKLSQTRRMKRKMDEQYGVDGEFFVDGERFHGDTEPPNITATITDRNVPPSTQHGLWCDWIPTEDHLYLQWNGSDKFYNYVPWLEYIIAKILEPRSYILNGEVKWQGENEEDTGIIKVVNNAVDATPDYDSELFYREYRPVPKAMPTLGELSKRFINKLTRKETN